jgi:ADP-ribose pyrophosphatase
VNPYTLLQSRAVYSNRHIHVREDKVIRPGGEPGIFGVVDMKAGSSILAMNAQQEVYLVREFKYALGRETLEVISGGIEPGEEPLAAARRELKEEAGLDSVEWVAMGRLDPFTTVIASPNYLFLALGVAEGPCRPDAGEILRVERVPFPRAVALLEAGEITHGASVALILKAERRFRP